MSWLFSTERLARDVAEDLPGTISVEKPGNSRVAWETCQPWTRETMNISKDIGVELLAALVTLAASDQSGDGVTMANLAMTAGRMEPGGPGTWRTPRPLAAEGCYCATLRDWANRPNESLNPTGRQATFEQTQHVPGGPGQVSSFCSLSRKGEDNTSGSEFPAWRELLIACSKAFISRHPDFLDRVSG